MTRRLPAFPGLLALALAWFCATPAFATAFLRDAAELISVLKSEPPCCVIDARSPEQQRKHPLAEALPYRADLRIIPSASVVVVADRDKIALAVAVALAKRYPGKVIYAVKGGVTAWESVLKALSGPAVSTGPDAPGGINFVIPRNTCESGTPLQFLRSKSTP